MIPILDLWNLAFVHIQEFDSGLSKKSGHLILKLVPLILEFLTMRATFHKKEDKNLFALEFSFFFDAQVFELVPALHVHTF
jgi:hypothetical protein